MAEANGDAETGNGEGTQETPPANGHTNDGEESIPRSRFVAALNNATDKYSALETKYKALESRLAQSATTPPPREFARSELLAAVDKGQMTLEQADAVWEKQIITRATNEARTVAGQELSQREVARRVDAEMRRYKELVPGVMQEGSKERERVSAEYRFMVSLGSPEGRETELAALRAVYGSTEKIERARGADTALDSEQQSGGAGGGTGRDDAANKGGDLARTLTARERDFYQKQIDGGRYKDWAAVNEELKFANPATRRKMGAKV